MSVDCLRASKLVTLGYMCVVLVYFLTLRISIFYFFMLDDKLVTL